MIGEPPRVGKGLRVNDGVQANSNKKTAGTMQAPAEFLSKRSTDEQVRTLREDGGFVYRLVDRQPLWSQGDDCESESNRC